MDEGTWSFINSLTIASAAIIACIALWRAYVKRVDEHINDLREQNKAEIADLRARLMVIEDALHISRNERLKYLPTVRMPAGQSEMKEMELD